MNLIFGAAGFAREVDWLCKRNQLNYKTDYFVAKDNVGEILNDVLVIGEEEAILKMQQTDQKISIVLAIASTRIREKIYERFLNIKNCYFPNIISNNAIFDESSGNLFIGIGNVICANVIFTANITVGNLNHFNLSCTIGHDTCIGDYCTFSPGVHISGNVKVGNNVFVGTGASILENLIICNDVIIGSGAVVTRSIVESGTYVGIPAKRIK